MGAEQSSSNRLSRAQEERILEAQRKLYEKRCRDIINSHRATQNVQQPATASRSSSQPNAPPPATIPPRPPAPLTRTNNITLYQPNSNSVDQENSLERNRSPYNYNQADLQNVRESNSRTNLYPNLNNGQTSLAGRPNTLANNNTFRFSNNNNASNTTNNIRPSASDFVFVNHNGSERLGASAPPRERSVSRTREDQDVMCPTCQNIIGLYIYNCWNGHSSCKFCKIRGAQCGKCGQSLTDIRNHALESYVAERKVPCLNKADGCNLVIKLADMESHVKECPFKEMPCPLHDVLGDCPWRGKINQIRIHFDNMHPAQRQGEEDKEMYLPNICSENKFAHLVVKGNFNFLLHLWVSEKDRMIYMTVQLIGTKVSALKWTYEIQMYNKREPRRKYQYLDACHSSNEPLTDIYREVRCAALPLAYAMNFVNEGAVCYKFTINKTFIGRSNFQKKNQRGRGGRRQ